MSSVDSPTSIVDKQSFKVFDGKTVGFLNMHAVFKTIDECSLRRVRGTRETAVIAQTLLLRLRFAVLQ